jgi:exopolysaccharide biosynthesis polyprenyl glycosylphosphotransferase
MTPSNRKILLEAGKVADVGLVFVALRFAYAIFNDSPAHIFLSRDQNHPVEGFLLTLGLAISWHVCLSSVGLYTSHRLDRFHREVGEIARGVGLCVPFALIWLMFITVKPGLQLDLCIKMGALFGITAAMLLGIARGANRLIIRELRKRGRNLRNVIIVGSNRRATSFAESLKARSGWGYHLHGFVDDFWWDRETSSSWQGEMLGGLDDLPELLRTMSVDEVVVALPMASFYNQIEGMVELCRQHGILVRFTGQLFDSGRPRRDMVVEKSAGTIILHDESWNAGAYLVKRMFDFCVASIFLLICSPILGLVALLVKLDSPGPVFFLQKRLGLGKRPFTIYKFRTMIVDAEKVMHEVIALNETNGPTFKLKNDPRITRIGKFLRKTSLDEIPQLLNIVLGDMSLVGPRPLPLRDYQGFSEDWQRRRFSVKPGITCLWQVMGRSSIGFEEWMALDLQYIDHWSVWLDIKILLQTVPAVLRGSGAV